MSQKGATCKPADSGWFIEPYQDAEKVHHGPWTMMRKNGLVALVCLVYLVYLVEPD